MGGVATQYAIRNTQYACHETYRQQNFHASKCAINPFRIGQIEPAKETPERALQAAQFAHNHPPVRGDNAQKDIRFPDVPGQEIAVEPPVAQIPLARDEERG